MLSENAPLNSNRIPDGTPGAADNRWLKEAYNHQIRVIYFLGIATGRYDALLSTFISGWDGQALKSRVTFGPNPETLAPPTDSMEPVSYTHLTLPTNREV